MDVFSWIWLGLFVVGFGVTETVAIVKGDTPGHPRTLTANVRALVTGNAWWHHASRLLLSGLLAWLPVHFGLV